MLGEEIHIDTLVESGDSDMVDVYTKAQDAINNARESFLSRKFFNCSLSVDGITKSFSVLSDSLENVYDTFNDYSVITDTTDNMVTVKINCFDKTFSFEFPSQLDGFDAECEVEQKVYDTIRFNAMES